LDGNTVRNVYSIALAISTTMSVSCGEHSRIFDNYNNNIYLAVNDSIIFSPSDSILLCSINDVTIDAHGMIYILDNIGLKVIKCKFRNSDMSTIGNPGNGPGEFDNPSHLTILSDNRLGVADGVNGWILFDSGGNCSSTLLIRSGSIGELFPINDREMILRRNSDSRLDDGTHKIDISILRTCIDNPDSVIDIIHKDYYLLASAANIENSILDAIRYSLYPPIIFAANDSYVCVADDPQHSSLILMYHTYEACVDTIDLGYPTIHKSDSFLSNEIRYIESHYSYIFSNYGVNIDWHWDPSPDYPLISSIFADNNGNFLIQRGFENSIVLDEFRPSGEYIQTYHFPERFEAMEWKVYINKYGTILYSIYPEDSYSLYGF
jgi:hypothetical protein